MSRRSEIGTGASWQTHARLRQRAPRQFGPSGRLPRWNGFSLRTGSFPPSARMSHTTWARTRTGCSVVRTGAPPVRPETGCRGAQPGDGHRRRAHARDGPDTPRPGAADDGALDADRRAYETPGKRPLPPCWASPGCIGPASGSGSRAPTTRRHPPRCSAADWPPTPGHPSRLLFPGDVWAPDAVAQLASSLSPRGSSTPTRTS